MPLDHERPRARSIELALVRVRAADPDRRPGTPPGAYRGPLRKHPGATPALVIGTTHDTWTPFDWARRLVADLGNARLLTFRGDGHDALTSFNPCIVGAMLGYLEEGALPAPGSVCRRDPPF